VTNDFTPEEEQEFKEVAERLKKERESTAVHEAGHAVVAERLGVEVIRASIVPDATTAGRVHHGLDVVRDLRFLDQPDILGHPGDFRMRPDVTPEVVRDLAHRGLAISTAGQQAEAVYMGLPLEDSDHWDLAWKATFDREQQRRILDSLIRDDFGFEGQIPEGWPRYLHDGPVTALGQYLLRDTRSRARAMIEREWSVIEKLSDALLERNELPGDQVREVIG